MLDFCLHFTYNEVGQQQSPVYTEKGGYTNGSRTSAGKERQLLHRS